MTQITRSIEIGAPLEAVWNHIQPCHWTKIFDFVREVDGQIESTPPGVGARVTVIAGDTPASVQYKIEVTEIVVNERIAYRRYDGPLNGRGVIEVKSLQNGTMFRRTSSYEDTLSEQTIDALSMGMENDNLRIKRLIESSFSQ